MNIRTIALAGMLAISGSANAALVSRLGGLAYYDTEADLTWLADANYAQTSGYDDDGLMSWADANALVTGLNINGVAGWRLADTTPVNGTAFDFTIASDGSTDRGYNISASGTAYAGSTGSEMANLFYNVLGNTASYDTNGNPTGCANFCLTNTGPFNNIQSGNYWAAKDSEPTTNNAWYFNFSSGYQDVRLETYITYAWAVHDGDVALISAVPIPAAAWLFGSALLGLVGLKRKQ